MSKRIKITIAAVQKTNSCLLRKNFSIDHGLIILILDCQVINIKTNQITALLQGLDKIDEVVKSPFNNDTKGNLTGSSFTARHFLAKIKRWINFINSRQALNVLGKINNLVWRR